MSEGDSLGGESPQGKLLHVKIWGQGTWPIKSSNFRDAYLSYIFTALLQINY